VPRATVPFLEITHKPTVASGPKTSSIHSAVFSCFVTTLAYDRQAARDHTSYRMHSVVQICVLCGHYENEMKGRMQTQGEM